MTPEAVDSLSKEELIALILAQQEQIRQLMARVAEFKPSLTPAQNAQQFLATAVEGPESKPAGEGEETAQRPAWSCSQAGGGP